MTSIIFSKNSNDSIKFTNKKTSNFIEMTNVVKQVVLFLYDNAI